MESAAMGVPRKLTLTLAALMTAQSLTGVIAPRHYRDVDWIKAAWCGHDWLTLVVAVPLLLMSSAGARRGSARAFLLCAGAAIMSAVITAAEDGESGLADFLIRRQTPDAPAPGSSCS